MKTLSTTQWRREEEQQQTHKPGMNATLKPPRSTFQLPKDSFCNFNDNCLNRHFKKWKFKRSTQSHEELAADTTEKPVYSDQCLNSTAPKE